MSLATGTKCLDWADVSDRGGTLGDCHAEVLSRRALLRFLYAQLELLFWYDHRKGLSAKLPEPVNVSLTGIA